jgi:hypothetical protein
MTQFDNLRQFRQTAYNLMGKARDALFDLMDAVLVTRSAASFAELSLSPVFRRQWPSLYEALQDSNPPRLKLMKLYTQQMPQEAAHQVVLAGDHTAWPRLHARTLRERTFEHHCNPMYGSKPITVGQGYSTLAWIPESQGSWALPLLHERITSAEKPIEKAAQQLQQVCQQLTTRPLSLWDSEYGCASFLNATKAIACDKLIRLRSNRVLYGPPPPPKRTGRPRLYGAKFKLNDADTWWTADEVIVVNNPKWERVELQMWRGLRMHGAADQVFSLICIQCLDPVAPHRTKPLWLIWVGEPPPLLLQLWKLYLRRFAIDHWYRFAKQRLHWNLPQLSTPEQSERWSDLMPLLTWQLWLARTQVQDRPRPWQKRVTKLTPGRTANAFPGVLAVIGTPAPSPKPRGKSPGWPVGQPRTQRIRYPTVKKTYRKPKTTAQKSA